MTPLRCFAVSEGMFFVTKFVKTLTIAGFATVAGFLVTPALGAAVPSNGSTYDGWLITPTQNVSLTADDTNPDDVVLTKAATFDSIGSLAVSFTQVSTTAASTITFDSESVTNDSGGSWAGFQFLLLNPSGNATFTDGGGSPFLLPGGFTSGTFASDNVVYVGTQGNKTTSKWGGKNVLSIATNPKGVGTTFDIDEVPLLSSDLAAATAGGIPLPTTSSGSTTTGGGPSTPAVPLPSAAKMGLLGLAIGVSWKNFRKRIPA
jgi:hypothetical protein